MRPLPRTAVTARSVLNMMVTMAETYRDSGDSQECVQYNVHYGTGLQGWNIQLLTQDSLSVTSKVDF